MNDNARQLLTLLAKKWLGTVIRAVLIALGTWLKATGKFPLIDDKAVNAAAAYAPDLAGDLLIAGGALWSGFEKWRATHKLSQALDLPAGSKVSDLKA